MNVRVILSGNPLGTHHIIQSSITLKSIVTTMAMFQSLDKFWMLLDQNNLGPPNTLKKRCAILVQDPRPF